MAAAEIELLLQFSSNSLMMMARTGILTIKANGTQLDRAQLMDQELKELLSLTLQFMEMLSE
jgi:hypothetical protein